MAKSKRKNRSFTTKSDFVRGYWKTISEAAMEWDVSEQRVREWARQKRLPGAHWKYNRWWIPADVGRPPKLRKGDLICGKDLRAKRIADRRAESKKDRTNKSVGLHAI